MLPIINTLKRRFKHLNPIGFNWENGGEMIQENVAVCAKTWVSENGT